MQSNPTEKTVWIVCRLSEKKDSKETEKTFMTEREAEEYVAAHSCKVCKDDIKNGTNSLNTDCGAEYHIEEVSLEEFRRRFLEEMAQVLRAEQALMFERYGIDMPLD
jgi:hypothetical protein